MSIYDIERIGNDEFLTVGEYGVVYRIKSEEITLIRGSLDFNHLNAIKFINPELIVAVGDKGTVLSSSDKGENWTKINDVPKENYIGIEIFNSKILMYSHNKIYIFEGNLNSYTEFEIGYDFFNKMLVSDKYLFITGENGLLLRVNKDNNNIKKIDLDTDSNVTVIKQKDNRIIAFVERKGIFKSDDSFDTFELIENELDALYSMQDLIWLDNDRILAVGDPFDGSLRHLYSEDFGKNWLINKYPFVMGNKFYQGDSTSLLVGSVGRIVKINNKDTINEENFDGFLDLIHTGYKDFGVRKIYYNDNKITALGDRVYETVLSDIDWKAKSDRYLFDHYFRSNNKDYYVKEAMDIREGRPYYTYHILSGENQNIDTVQAFEESLTRRDKMIANENFVILYGSGTTFLIKYENEELFTEFEMEYHPRNMVYEDGILYAIAYIDNKHKYIYSNDMGKSWVITDVEFPNSYSLIDIDNNKTYILTSESINAFENNNTIIEVDGKNIKDIYEFKSLLSPGKFQVDNGRFVIIKRDEELLISDKNGKNWKTEIVGENKGLYESYVNEDFILVSDNKEIYYKRIDEIINSVQETKLSNSVIYPNPCKDELNISFENNYLGKIEIELYDFLGKKLDSYSDLKNSNNFMKNIDITGLNQGNYYLIIRLDVEEIVNNFKVIK